MRKFSHLCLKLSYKDVIVDEVICFRRFGTCSMMERRFICAYQIDLKTFGKKEL